MKSNERWEDGRYTVVSVNAQGGVDTYQLLDHRGYRKFIVISTQSGDFKTPNPHSFVGFKVDALPYHGKTRNQDSSWTSWSGNVLRDGWFNQIPESHESHVKSSDLQGDANNDAMENIYKWLRGNANLAVDLAEGRETKAMLKNFYEAARRIRLYRRNPNELVKDLKTVFKGDVKQYPQRGLSTASNAWMQYRYGIMPLVYSTYDLLKTHVMSPLKGLTQVKGRGVRRQNASSKFQHDVNTVELIQEELTVRVQHVFYFDMAGGKHVHDWTSLDPARIAWELAPLSFVADWFVNVSQVLELIENHRIFAKSFVSGCSTVTIQRKSKSTVNQSENTGWPKYSVTAGRYTRSFSKTRNRVYTLPFPDKPSIQVKLNSKRFIDAAALIYQAVRR